LGKAEVTLRFSRCMVLFCSKRLPGNGISGKGKLSGEDVLEKHDYSRLQYENNKLLAAAVQVSELAREKNIRLYVKKPVKILAKNQLP